MPVEVTDMMSNGLFLGSVCVGTGFVTTVSQRWAAETNTTGRLLYGSVKRPHTFDHVFFLQACIFLAQLVCYGLHRLKVKRMGPVPEEEVVNNGDLRHRERIRQLMRPRQNQAAENKKRKEEGKDGEEGVVEGQEPAEVGAIGGPEMPIIRRPAERPKPERVRPRAADIEVIEEAAEQPIRRRRGEGMDPNLAQQRRGPRIARRIQKDKKEYNKIIFLPCTLCDFARVGLLFIGFKQTYPSSFIMLQGVGLMSTCLLTVAFVGRDKTVKKLHWVGASISTVGLAVAGIRDFVWGDDPTYDPYGIAAGCLLIVMAQLMTAIQVILEQRFVKKHDIDPLLAVGLQGMFGSVILLLLLIPFYFVKVGAFNTIPGHRLEDPYDAFLQMGSDPWLIAAFIGSVVFLPLFYYFGVTITKKIDAVHRMGAQLNIKIVAWLLYLALGWEQTHPIQILGFTLAFTGVVVFFFNSILDRYRASRGLPREGQEGGNPEERAPLLNQENPDIQDYGAQGPPEVEHRNRPM